MRAGLVGIFFFAAVLASGHYFAAPMFCRGALSLPTLDPVQLCTDGALNRQGSMLLYFFAVAAAMFFGILAALIPGRRTSEKKGPEKPETFEEIIAAQEKTAAPAVAAPAAAAPVVASAAAAAALSAEASAASVPASAPVEAKGDGPQPTPIDMEKSGSITEAAVMDAVRAAVSGDNNSAAKSDTAFKEEVRKADQAEGDKSADEKTEGKAATPDSPAAAETAEAKTPQAENVEGIAVDVEPEPAAHAASLEDVRAAFESVERDLASAPQAVAAPQTVPEPAPQPASTPPGPEAVYEPETLAAAEAISAGLSANPSGVRKPFEGTVEELVERFRQLRLVDGTNSVAQAQRLLDESTLGALAKGIDPKQHLSDVAHLVLAEDPDLKSSVVRGVVVHIASRLKELGVAQRQPAQPVR